MSDPFQLAAKQLGMNERDQNAALAEYMTNGGVNLDPAVTAWCAAYVNATLAQSGMKGTGSNMARSFLDWGQEVDQPQKGDLAIFSRGDPNGPYGHVGFFDGYNDDGTIRVLGGNQGSAGEVSISNYGPDRLLGFRRADGTPVDANGQPVQGNALAGMTGPAGAPGAPQPQQNALATMQQPQMQWTDMRQSVEPFLRPTRNALAMG